MHERVCVCIPVRVYADPRNSIRILEQQMELYVAAKLHTIHWCIFPAIYLAEFVVLASAQTASDQISLCDVGMCVVWHLRYSKIMLDRLGFTISHITSIFRSKCHRKCRREHFINKSMYAIQLRVGSNASTADETCYNNFLKMLQSWTNILFILYTVILFYYHTAIVVSIPSITRCGSRREQFARQTTERFCNIHYAWLRKNQGTSSWLRFYDGRIFMQSRFAPAVCPLGELLFIKIFRAAANAAGRNGITGVPHLQLV